MPLLMDDTLDIDELFGDDNALPLPHVPFPKGLAQRVDELRTIGCCQKVTWSRYNSVAYITGDGLGVIIRHLLRSQEDGKWTLSGPYLVPQVGVVHQGVQLCHVLWNQRTLDLAVVDVLGRISVFTIVIAINRLAITRPNISDQDDDLGAVVGMIWLNTESTVPWYRSATKTEGRFNYNISQYKTMGPFAPKNRTAIVCITRGGILRLLYPQPDGRWNEVKKSIDSLSTSDDVLSHASFCPDRDNTLLLIVRTISRKYRLYRVQINWNVLAATQASAGHPQVPSSPVISLQNLKVALSAMEEIQYSSRVVDASQMPPQLSHLELLPVAPQSKYSEPTAPTVLMVFSQLQGPYSPGYQENYSVIVRWELQAVTQKLHPRFDQLNSKKKSISSFQSQSLGLKRLDDILVEKVLLSVQLLGPGTILGLAYSDGTIEFRDRIRLDVVGFDGNLEKVTSLPGIGFAFPSEGPCLSTSLSPNYCAAVSIDDEGDPHLRVMRYALGEISTSTESAKSQMVIAALAMQIAAAVNTTLSKDDDILAAIQQLSNPSVEQGILSEVYRAMMQSTDYALDPQPDKLSRNLNVLRCFSLQETFGHQLERSHRNLTSKVAKTTMDFRLATLIFAFTFITEIKGAGGQVIENDFTKPDVLQSLFGIIRWCIDIINFLTDELLEMSTLLRGRFNDLDLINETIKSTGSCALPLITSSMPRCLLRYALRCLGIFSATAAKRLPREQDSEQRQAFAMVLNITDSTPTKHSRFDSLLLHFDSAIRIAYEDQSISEAERGIIEKNMFINCQIPPILLPVIEKLFKTLLPELLDEIDPAALYFRDFAWLGLNDDHKTKSWLKQNPIDVMRKTPLGQRGRGGGGGGGQEKVRLRRCIRCASFMEDFVLLPGPTERGGSGGGGGTGTGAGGGTGSNTVIGHGQRPGRDPFWMATLQKTCHCGNMWMISK